MPNEELQLEFSVGKGSGQHIARLRGPLTLGNLVDFQTKVRADKSPLLILDLSEVPYVDSAGIGALVGAHVSHQKEGHRLALVGVSERVRKALKVTGVEQLLSIFPTQEDAEKSAP
jgi:anti-sigma B factor antagonist